MQASPDCLHAPGFARPISHDGLVLGRAESERRFEGSLVRLVLKGVGTLFERLADGLDFFAGTRGDAVEDLGDQLIQQAAFGDSGHGLYSIWIRPLDWRRR